MSGPAYDTRYRLHVQNGSVHRFGRVCLLVGAGSPDVVGSLVAAAEAAATDGQPLSAFNRSVAGLLSSAGRVPPVCALQEAAQGISAVLHGSGRVEIRTGLSTLELTGTGEVTVDGFVAGPVVAVRAELGGRVVGADDESSDDAAVPDSWSTDHESAASTTDTAPPTTTAHGRIASRPRPSPGPSPLAVSTPVGAPVLVAPVMVAPAAAGPATIDAMILAELDGVLCRRNHFNDPHLRYCAICGIGLTQAGRVTASAPRPALGVLVADDGRVLPLDRDYLLGGSPEGFDEVQAGLATPVVLGDHAAQDAHTLVRLRDWDVSVSNAGSSGGTFVHDPDSSWELVPPGEQRSLRPGSLIALGSRQLRFDSYRR